MEGAEAAICHGRICEIRGPSFIGIAGRDYNSALEFIVRRKFLEPVREPIAAVGYPPGDEEDRDGGKEGPPEWEHKIGEEAEQGKDHPE